MPKENLYKRGAVWWMRCSANGVEYRASLRTGDLKTARRLRDKRLAEITAAAYHGEVKHTWEEAVTEWAKHAIGQIGRSTTKRYAVSLKQCEPYLKSVDISKIDGKVIQNLITYRRNLDKATPATVRRDLTAISRVLEHAEALGWREGNPTLSKRRLLKERRDPIVLPTVRDIDLIVARSSPRFGGLISAALMTGCRQEELTTVRWSQFNGSASTLEIIGKGNKRRTIQLSEMARRHIDGTVRVLGSDLIFCTPQGTKWASPASYFVKIRTALEKKADHARAWHDALKGKNVRDELTPSQLEEFDRLMPLKDFRPFRFHDLRHYFAVKYLQDGGNIYVLSKHLGHTSVGITERVYLAFLTPEEADAAKYGKVA